MNESAGHPKDGFTLVELLVVIAVIGILASILIPSFTHVLKTAARIDDTSRLRNIGAAMFAFANDDGGMIPQAFLSQRCTAHNDARGGEKGGHLAYVLKDILGGKNLAEKELNPHFAGNYWLRKIGAGTSNPQQWLDANESDTGIARYATHRWSISHGTGQVLFPFPFAGTGGSPNYVRFGLEAVPSHSSTWMMTDADTQVRSYFVLEEPLHGDVRVTLYWDGSVHKIPVVDYHEGGPDGEIP